MNKLILVPALAAFISATACAEGAPEFSEVDTDSDGVLSISEMEAALPDVPVTDANDDGLVNQSEAEAAIAGLAFTANGYSGGNGMISESEYRLLVDAIDSDETDTEA